MLLDERDGHASEGGVLLLLVTEAVSVSSGMVANFFKTCFRAGRLIGLLGFKCQVGFLGCRLGYLPKEHIHSRVIAIFDIAFLCKCGECNDWSRVAHLPDESSTLKTVKVWHLQLISSCPQVQSWLEAYLYVHEDQIKEFAL